MNAIEFSQRWSRSELGEQQSSQSHFDQLCHLVTQKSPTEADPLGKFFVFEQNVEKTTGGRGRADVWYKGHFAWEYKGKSKDLDAAYAQLLTYKGGLDNPPLLVVCDFDEYRVYPQWPNIDGKPIIFRNEDLAKPDQPALRYLEWVLTDPDKFLQLRQHELEERIKVTKNLAKQFADLADLMRNHNKSWTEHQIARFLTRIMFLLFAEDVGLIQKMSGKSLFEVVLQNTRDDFSTFVPTIQDLFETLDGRQSVFMGKRLPYFNGKLFAGALDEGEHPEVLDITQIPDALRILQDVSAAKWEGVNPTIFGTVFEGALDHNKRGQLGIHYTSEADIRLVLEPVLMRPLNREWDTIQEQAALSLREFLSNDSTPREKLAARHHLTQLHDYMTQRLESTTVLDPACGSGNFLYMSLRLMKDLEGRVRKFFEPLNLPFRDVVTPRQFYGIEKDEFAANLAHVVIWIGYLQWRFENEDGLHPTLPNKPTTSRDLPHPILKDKDSPDEPDRILNADAIMRYNADGIPYEPDWPVVNVIVGNPPFLGGNRIRQELRGYVDDLFLLYQGRIPAFSDLVCYWFEKARAQLEAQETQRCGLLATNSIRGGVNREVLNRIKKTGDIFMSWPDHKWVLDGAAVRVSIIGFDDKHENEIALNGRLVSVINADLTSSVDLTAASTLNENLKICFIGAKKAGDFDIEPKLANHLLAAQNQSQRSNSDVLFAWLNGEMIVKRMPRRFIISFGEMSLEEAKLYEKPFEYVFKNVFEDRQKNNEQRARERWWQHRRPAIEMREAVAALERFIATPRVSKHRIFVWQPSAILPDDGVYIFAREDDYFFGVLHSYLHELWSLRLGTSLEDRPRYTPTTTFDTFPLPFLPGQEDTESPHYQAISRAAKQLNDERDAWLNPPEYEAFTSEFQGSYKELTLTNLYNALVDCRKGNMVGYEERVQRGSAALFAPRLAELHDMLDRSVLAAYGWSDLDDKLRTSEGDEELLRRLLKLNLRRAG